MNSEEQGALIGLTKQWDALSRIVGPDQKAILHKCSEDLRQLVNGLMEAEKGSSDEQ